MARVFDITAASDAVRLDGNGQGEIAFTASNVTGRPLRGRANLVPQDASSKAWFSVSGGPERDFPASGTQQFSVKVSVPPGTKTGKYNFRLDVVSVQNPDEDYAQGPNVAVSVALSQPPKPFPWWILVVAGVALIAVGGVTWYLLKQPSSTVDVPQIVGLTPDAATKALSNVNLTGQQQGQEQTGKVNPGLVSSQNPAPTSTSNAKLASGSTVTFKVEATGSAQQEPVPDVSSSHMLLDPAIHKILDAGFTVDEPSQRIAPVELVGKVINQSPMGAAPIGSPVHLTVGMIKMVDWKAMVSPQTLARIQAANARRK